MARATQSYHSLILNTVVPLLLCAITGGLVAAAVIVSLSKIGEDQCSICYEIPNTPTINSATTQGKSADDRRIADYSKSNATPIAQLRLQSEGVSD